MYHFLIWYILTGKTHYNLLFQDLVKPCELTPTRTPPATPWYIPQANDMVQPSCKVIPLGKSLLRYLKSTSVLSFTCCSVDLDITVFDMTKVPEIYRGAVAGNYNLQNDCEGNSHRLTTPSWCCARVSMRAIFGGNRKAQWR